MNLESYTLNEQTLSVTYDSWTHTLRDLCSYSPYAIDGCHLRLLFIVYQLLKIISFIHQRGLCCGAIQLTDIHINERYWIQLKPRLQSCLASMEFTSDGHPTTRAQTDDYSINSSPDPISRQTSIQPSAISMLKSRSCTDDDESSVQTTMIVSPIRNNLSNSMIYHVEQRYETYCQTHIDIVELIKQWQLGHISNFDYLLILNALVGRKFHDPNHHLIFPWIHDFTSSTANLRNLSQSKYRLNKGIFNLF